MEAAHSASSWMPLPTLELTYSIKCQEILVCREVTFQMFDNIIEYHIRDTRVYIGPPTRVERDIQYPKYI